MATWSDVVAYVRENFQVSEERPNMIKMLFDTGDLRAQVVFLWRATLMDGGEEWVQIESPFGEMGAVDLEEAVVQVGKTVCGGMSCIDNIITLRHAIPLLNLDINEFVRPLTLVTSTADKLERALVGGDRF